MSVVKAEALGATWSLEGMVCKKRGRLDGYRNRTQKTWALYTKFTTNDQRRSFDKNTVIDLK
jgi:hypothetical protein